MTSRATIRHLNVPLSEDDGSLIFGEPVPNPDMKDPDEKRFWTNDDIVADFQVVQDFNIDSGIPHINDTVFIPEDGIENYLDNCTVLKAIPYLGKEGQFTKSLWAILN